MLLPSFAVLASGTRGDIQPLAALGQGLRNAGADVQVVTHPPFRGLVEGAGLRFVPLDGDLNMLLQPATGEGALTVGGNPLRALATSVRYLRAAQPLFERMIDDAWHTCKRAEALIVTLPTLWGVQIAEALDIPCFAALLQPLAPTAAFPSVFLPSARSYGGAYNRISHHLLLRLIWLPWRAALGRWRRQALGLASALPAGPWEPSVRRNIPWLHGLSEAVVPRPHDWPAQHVLTGYWFLDQPATWDAPPALRAFLDAGPPPVYIGFGSMGALTPGELEHVLAALRSHGLRALLATDAADTPLPSWAFALAAAPHDWLFQRVAAVVHHGGAGTTAAALRAGVPQIIMPVAVDQRFWGWRAAALGVAPAPVPRRELSSAWLSHALECVLAAGPRERASSISMRLRAERGVERAVACMRQSL